MPYVRKHRRMGVGAVGEYDRVNNWSWMYYPPPYDFADPLPLRPPATFIAPAESMDLGPAYVSGMGCAGDSCKCGGKCGGHGVGDAMPNAIDFSNFAPMSTYIADHFGLPIPNIVVYGVGAFLFAKMSSGLFSGASTRRVRSRR